MDSARRVGRDVAAALDFLQGLPAEKLAATLTLLLLLLQPVGPPSVRPWVLLLAAAGLLVPALAQRPWLWLALAGLLAARVVADWPMSDNHAYLLAYWCLALALAPGSRRPGGALARAARLLIGLAFLLATLQKAVVSPDFVGGTFFRHVLLVDHRFESLTHLLGLDTATLETNRALLEADPHLPAPGGEVVETPALRAAADALTWGTLAMEAAVALLFLAPLRAGRSWLRDAALLAFCAATYPLAPVQGFGWLLLAMGVAQSGSGATWRALYLASFALLLLYREIPLLDALAVWAGVG